MLFHFQCLFQRGRPALHQRSFFRELSPFAFGGIKLQLSVEGIGGGLDRTPGIEPGNHVSLRYRLAFRHVEIGQFAIDGRIKTPHFRLGHERALRRHDHIGVPEKRPDQRRQHQCQHCNDKRLGETPGFSGQNRNAFGTVVFKCFGEWFQAVVVWHWWPRGNDESYLWLNSSFPLQGRPA